MAVLGCCLWLALSGPAVGAQSKNPPKDARSAVQTFFSLLKSQQYSSLYSFLPSQLQQQITPEQLSQSLKRLSTQIVIDRLEIGRVQEKGEFAVVDTIIYGQLKKNPNRNGEVIEIKEGRISVQQYLYREGDQWKIATADNRSRAYFLRRHPDFSKQFQLSLPRFEAKQDGRWRPLQEVLKQ